LIKTTIKPSIDKIKRDFKDRKKKLADFKPAYKKASIYLDGWVQKNFLDEGAGLGADRWPDFSMGGRINQKGIGSPIEIGLSGRVIDAFLDTSAKLLQLSGRLRMSFLPFATKDDAGVGSHLFYSKFHDEGVGFLPKRRMLPKEAEVHDKLEEILHDHGMKALDSKK